MGDLLPILSGRKSGFFMANIKRGIGEKIGYQSADVFVFAQVSRGSNGGSGSGAGDQRWAAVQAVHAAVFLLPS